MLAAEVLIAAWALIICLIDFRTKRIPNALCLVAIVFGVGYMLSTGSTALGAHWVSALAAAGLRLVLTVPAWLMGWLGGDDVKLLFAIALLAGWHLTLISFAIAGLIAGLALIIMLWLSRYMGFTLPRKKWIPFGSALSVGLMIAMGMS